MSECLLQAGIAKKRTTGCSYLVLSSYPCKPQTAFPPCRVRPIGLRKTGLLLPGANCEALRGPGGGGGRGRGLPQHPQVPQGLRPLCSQERRHVHPRDRQAHP